MDQFAQSMDDVDLFDDDVVLVEPSEQEAQVETVAEQVPDISLENAPKGPSAGIPSRRGYDARGDKSRGRGGRGRGSDRSHPGQQQSSSLSQSKHAPPSIQSSDHPAAATDLAPVPSNVPNPTESEAAPAPVAHTESEVQVNPPIASLTQPATPARPPAVRGDRTATGGIKKPKLTEEELTAKLAAAKTRSESRSAAHARAEEDAANFAERERAAAEKRVKDVANRKVMEGEREKNRARKIAVMGGREWDAEKNEEDFKTASRGRGRGNYTRGADRDMHSRAGDPFADDLRQYQWKDDAGGRGPGRRRGRGTERGAPRGRAHDRNGAGRQPDMAAQSDFPSLPLSTKPKDDLAIDRKAEAKTTGSDLTSPTPGTGSWADQVEVCEAAKPKAG